MTFDAFPTTGPCPQKVIWISIFIDKKLNYHGVYYGVWGLFKR
jgi:hypothetical protein